MVPINDMLSKAQRQYILATRHRPDRRITERERMVIVASVEAMADAGSEDQKMILASIYDIMGFYNK